MAAPAHHAHPSRERGDAAENYAKAIYALQSRGEGAVGTNAIAERLGVSAGSASAMIKRLAEEGLVERTPYRGVRLTKRGEQVALEVIRHHRLLELFLAEILEVPWDRVHDEAEVLEHHLSDELTDRIARKLGHPTRDPHGDPIPSEDLELEQEQTVSLESMAEGGKGTFVRVSDADPAMLRYLSDRGIAPGDRFTVVERQPFDGPLTLRFDGSEVTLGGELARAMRVEVRRSR